MAKRNQDTDTDHAPDGDRQQVDAGQGVTVGPTRDNRGRTPGADEIAAPTAAERATMSSRDKAAADPTRSAEEAATRTRTPIYRDRMIHSPEQNPPLNDPDRRAHEPLSDSEVDSVVASEAPTGARVPPKPAPLGEPEVGPQVKDWRNPDANIPGMPPNPNEPDPNAAGQEQPNA